MTRKTWLVGGLLSATVIVGGAGFWRYARNSAQPQREPAPKTAATETEAVSVQVKLPERGELARQVGLPGSIEALEQVTLYAKTAGYLKWIKVDIGDRVRKGQALAEIDVPEMAPEYKGAEAEVESALAKLGNAQAELERAKAELDLKKITYERFKSIRDQDRDVMPQQQVDEAKAQFDMARATVNVAESKIKVAQSEIARAEAVRARLSTLMEYTKILAPFDGVVTTRYVDPGALIQHASSQTNVSPVVTVARTGTLRVFVDVTEPEVPFIKRGIPVTLTVDAMPGKTYRGACTRFAIALDPKTRTMRTAIDIPNRDGLLRPGMFGRVSLGLERRKDALTVPASAILTEGGKTYVYTVENGKARRVEVRTGLDDGIRVEVTGGLAGDESVIVTGKGAVKDGVMVKISRT
ncbi:MAG: efflux RND transporter periplasmic adaptor subunit [Acidobacteria bacterium]|nr:efflux RND transporter periplasmic adaptor subunit [Acidobacteriota bacterium]